MKKVVIAVISVILILTFSIGFVVYNQWDNIKVIYMTFSYSDAEIEKLVKDNDAKINKILNELTDTEMHPLNEEESEMLYSGNMSQDDALNIIMGKDNQIQDSSSTGPVSGVSVSGTDDIISRIYLLRAEYIGALSALEASGRAEAGSIPKSERTVTKKLDFIERYTAKGVALESQCDARMEALLSELEAEIRRTGGNKNLVSEVRSVYANEKQVKKSQLFGKYL